MERVWWKKEYLEKNGYPRRGKYRWKEQGMSKEFVVADNHRPAWLS